MFPDFAQYAPAIHPRRYCHWKSGGFSGAQLWRLETKVGLLCLRRWPPEHPSPDRLKLIHQVLRHAASRGIDFVSIPFPTADGRTFVKHEGTLWEISPWLRGEPNFSAERRPEKLRAALAALARFHLATGDFASPSCRVGPSPGIVSRLAKARTPWSGTRDLPMLHAEVVRLFQQLAPSVARELAAAAMVETRLQPAIRDVWADHFLFTSDEVAGLVDFGSLNIDTPATDIARLLGSMAGDDEQAWQMGLAAYEAIRPLSESERQLVPVFDRSSVLLSGMNWLRWIHLEGRTFNDPQAIEARLAAIVRRLRHAAAHAR